MTKDKMNSILFIDPLPYHLKLQARSGVYELLSRLGIKFPVYARQQ